MLGHSQQQHEEKWLAYVTRRLNIDIKYPLTFHATKKNMFRKKAPSVLGVIKVNLNFFFKQFFEIFPEKLFYE